MDGYYTITINKSNTITIDAYTIDAYTIDAYTITINKSNTIDAYTITITSDDNAPNVYPNSSTNGHFDKLRLFRYCILAGSLYFANGNCK
jgi:hypothetical protein